MKPILILFLKTSDDFKISIFFLRFVFLGIKLNNAIHIKACSNRLISELVPMDIKNCVSRPFCKTVTPEILPKH